MALGLVLGLRPRELTGLKWDHIDFDAGIIWIVEWLKHRKGRLSQGSTKTKRSRRKIKACHGHAGAESAPRTTGCRKISRASLVENGYVFATLRPDAIDPPTCAAFRSLIKAAGYPPSGQPKTTSSQASGTRTICATPQAATWTTGRPAQQIAETLGHAGTRTTEEVYIHNQEIIDMNSGAFETYW